VEAVEPSRGQTARTTTDPPGLPQLEGSVLAEGFSGAQYASGSLLKIVNDFRQGDYTRFVRKLMIAALFET
jgi:hypothetical protein